MSENDNTPNALQNSASNSKESYRTPTFVVGGCATMLSVALCAAGPVGITVGAIGLIASPYSWLTAKSKFTSIAQKVPKYISSAKSDPKKRAGYAAALILWSNGAFAGFTCLTVLLADTFIHTYKDRAKTPFKVQWGGIAGLIVGMTLAGLVVSLPAAPIGYYLGRKYLADYAGDNST